MVKKVSAILKGGLGNYMFQVAAAHAYGMRKEDLELYNKYL